MERQIPVAEHSSAQQQQKYEDVIVCQPSSAGFRHFSCFALFDGHGSSECSSFCSTILLSELERRLPTAIPDPNHYDQSAQHLYADHVRRVLTAVFLRLQLAWKHSTSTRSRQACHKQQAASPYGGCGCTATIVLQTGNLLTVGNVGNTKCVLDVGHTSFELTSDHKLGNNEDEEERLDAAGACIARLKFDLSGPAMLPHEVGCGPLRIWPSGLHMSRALGDYDCSDGTVLPHPHIMQLWLPGRASRLIMASGSVWDPFETFQKAVCALRGVSLPNAANALLQRSLSRKQHLVDRGDLSVVVVDFVPESCAGFSSQVRLDRLSRSSVCSSLSNGNGAAATPTALSFLRRNSPSPRLPGKLSPKGMQPPALQVLWKQQQQQQQQQHNRVPGTWARHSSHAADMHQQQQQLPGLLQRLLPKLCFGPPAADGRASSTKAMMLQLQHFDGGSNSNCSTLESRTLQQAPSFGSSNGDGALISSSNSTATASSGSSMRAGGGSSSSIWRARSSWRSNSSRTQAVSPQLQQVREDVSVARIIARCDTFKVYFGGLYQSLERQLAMIDVLNAFDAVPAAAELGAVHGSICSPSVPPHTCDGGDAAVGVDQGHFASYSSSDMSSASSSGTYLTTSVAV